ncbi:hypothetical protein LN042_29485 [Kitasatospora sp. RB6PN24]|uniref:hypothetical protein n=1 Tax=Kitasatospora humi TaxID=2893891 RepID=UPI001E2A8171|nr:hypothetical protein [Kitasatospora humi]MCC9311146.1 hypothetical protein [Kitasatospora humi]
MPTSVLVVDHPAWETVGGTASRIMRSPTGTWLATWGKTGLSLSCLDGSEDTKPQSDEITAAELPEATDCNLAAALADLGTVVRLPNPSLWDAITTAVLRQVVRAAQARALYHRWCAAYGTGYDTPVGRLAVVPGPESVLALSEEAFKAVGAAFHRTALQAAAAAYLEGNTAWSALDPAHLVDALDTIPRIGPWTASAATADFTGDFSVYPHGDLAVRTWAKRAAPDVAWPTTDKAFCDVWTRTAENARQLHALTLLTLAWGSNASSEPREGAEHQRQ